MNAVSPYRRDLRRFPSLEDLCLYTLEKEGLRALVPSHMSHKLKTYAWWKVLCVVGGNRDGNTCLGGCQVVDVALGRVTTGPSLPLMASDASACVDTETGRIFVVGGTSDDDEHPKSAMVWDGEGKSWSFLPGTMRWPRDRCMSVFYDQTLYVIGGHQWGAGRGANLGVELFRETVGSWETMDYTPIHNRIDGHVACFQNKLYLWGGLRLNRTIEVFDPRNPAGGWATLSRAPLPLRGSATCSLETQGIFSSGGWCSAYSDYTDSTFLMDPRQDQCVFLKSAPQKRAWTRAAPYNNRVYIVGGDSGEALRRNDIIIYDIRADKWDECPLQVDPRGGHACGWI